MADEPTGLSAFVPPLLLDQIGSTSDKFGIAFISAIPRAFIGTVLVESEEFGQRLFKLDEQESQGPEPPTFVRLTVLNDDPDDLLLERQ